MDLQKMSVSELKILAFDLQEKQQITAQNLQAVLTVIAQKKKEEAGPTPKPTKK